MCTAPNILNDGTETACHKCWQCRERAIADWTGRNIAEMKTAKACHAVTLTYGRNDANAEEHERSVLLTYSDVQKFLYLLRRHGYPVRYFVAGEFGTKKGRAHWHIILYWQDRVPPNIPLRQNWMFARYNEKGEQAQDENGDPAFFWPHGWTYWQKVTPHTARYVCKYLQKGMGDDVAQGRLQMSKYPPLGTEYFERLAERYVGQGLAPQTLEYSFPGVRKREKNGRMVEWKYMLTGRTAELFLDQYIAAWSRLKGDQPRPKSPLVDLYEEHGKIVWDEEKFLHRRYLARWMPKGETKKPMATAEEMLAMGRDAARTRALASPQYAVWARLQHQLIEDAPDGEERQRRQEQFEWEREVWLQNWRDAKLGKPKYVKRNDAAKRPVLRPGPGGDRITEQRERMEQQWDSRKSLSYNGRRRRR
jgi:hypothetical protein